MSHLWSNCATVESGSLHDKPNSFLNEKEQRLLRLETAGPQLVSYGLAYKNKQSGFTGLHARLLACRVSCETPALVFWKHRHGDLIFLGSQWHVSFVMSRVWHTTARWSQSQSTFRLYLGLWVWWSSLIVEWSAVWRMNVLWQNTEVALHMNFRRRQNRT